MALLLVGLNITKLSTYLLILAKMEIRTESIPLLALAYMN